MQHRLQLNSVQKDDRKAEDLLILSYMHSYRRKGQAERYTTKPVNMAGKMTGMAVSR